MSPKLFLVLFLGVVLLTATSSLARSSAQTTTEDEPERTLMMGNVGKKGPSKSGPKLPSNYKPPTFSVHDQEFEAMADDGTYEDPEKPEKPRATGATGRDGEEAIREADE
ncbi:hypothetical protein TIFTF001_022557 [Ficus carica]|uniref:Uncharacterized protein n=1 Tax=Ficus carica TaxID=3494 RepID=A0AA88DK07_FICCA|nr:hypothetical protein TIFTF001_022557 [Ficus carica]